MALNGINAPYLALGHVYLQHLAFNDLDIDDTKATGLLVRYLSLKEICFQTLLLTK